MRSEPNLNANIITTVDAQAAIIIVAQRSDAEQLWYRVRVNDYHGWMHASLFNLSAQQQALVPWEQAMIIATPTIQPTNRPYATQRPAVSRPRATAKPSIAASGDESANAAQTANNQQATATPLSPVNQNWT